MPEFLSDPNFWAVVVAAIAVLLSQLPPIKSWFKKARVHVEVFSRISITHKVGNPNAQLHIIVSNDGGRSTRIRNMSVSFARNKQHRFTLPVQSYLREPDSKSNVMFTPFVLPPAGEWAHIVNFFDTFSREDDRRLRQLMSSVRAEIFAQRATMPEPPRVLLEATAPTVAAINQFYTEKFDWLPGEYEMTLTVEPEGADTYTKVLPLTVFESDTAELRALADDYKYGAGIYWDRPDAPLGVLIPLRERP